MEELTRVRFLRQVLAWHVGVITERIVKLEQSEYKGMGSRS